MQSNKAALHQLTRTGCPDASTNKQCRANTKHNHLQSPLEEDE